MIDMQSIGDRTDEHLIRNPMGVTHETAPHGEAAVAVLRDVSLPDPAAVGIDDDSGEDPVAYRRRRYHVSRSIVTVQPGG
jgi:hypothetical protein